MRWSYNEDAMQHSLATKLFMRGSPVPVAQQPMFKGGSVEPLDDAQHPEPYIAAKPTRPPTYYKFKKYENTFS